MDERYLLAAARYVERNPVRARIVERPEDYPWSSTKAHLAGSDDDLVKAAPLLSLVDDWKSFISNGTSGDDGEAIRRHECTGRPLGDDDFIAWIEQEINRILRRQKPGPKSKSKKRLN